MTMIGSYPCCDGTLFLAMPDRTPAYLPEDCPHCGAKVWHRFSRLDPMSWTEADFLEEHTVDAVAMTIVPKKPPPEPLPPEVQAVVDEAIQRAVKKIVDDIIHGDPSLPPGGLFANAAAATALRGAPRYASGGIFDCPPAPGLPLPGETIIPMALAKRMGIVREDG